MTKMKINSSKRENLPGRYRREIKHNKMNTRGTIERSFSLHWINIDPLNTENYQLIEIRVHRNLHLSQKLGQRMSNRGRGQENWVRAFFSCRFISRLSASLLELYPTNVKDGRVHLGIGNRLYKRYMPLFMIFTFYLYFLQNNFQAKLS